ncbi:Methyl-branched lipid omega-hydroxylase [bacterium HR12]|nr:Methyl-branched lipid omega-hydroxylase [bacterium HR12]
MGPVVGARRSRSRRGAHRAFELLRREDPVQWQEEPPPNHGFWAITRFRDIEQVLADPRTFSSARGVTLEEQTPEEVEARRSMIDMDPPQHSRLRRIVSRLFTRSAVAGYEDFCRELARRVLDRALPKEEFDFVEEISRELPIRILARIMGVPEEDTPQIIEWGDSMIAHADPEYSRAVIDREDTSDYRLLPFRSPAAVDMMAYAHRLAAERRREPRDDLVTKLIHAEVDGQRLTEQEFDNFFCLLAVAGNETTRHAISHGMLALMEHREQWRRLRDDPGLMPLATEEILRWGTPTMHFRRTATRDVELGGKGIREGDKVVVWFVSGNRDEEAFPEPFRFDVGRQPNPQMAFGSGGPHVCLGAHLARLEIRVMFEELLPRLADIELTGPVVRLRSNFINGIKHMPVRVRLA